MDERRRWSKVLTENRTIGVGRGLTSSGTKKQELVESLDLEPDGRNLGRVSTVENYVVLVKHQFNIGNSR